MTINEQSKGQLQENSSLWKCRFSRTHSQLRTALLSDAYPDSVERVEGRGLHVSQHQRVLDAGGGHGPGHGQVNSGARVWRKAVTDLPYLSVEAPLPGRKGLRSSRRTHLLGWWSRGGWTRLRSMSSHRTRWNRPSWRQSSRACCRWTTETRSTRQSAADALVRIWTPAAGGTSRHGVCIGTMGGRCPLQVL